MLLLREIFDKYGKHFEEGGRLNAFYQFYEAMESFFFSSGKVTHNGTHIRDSLDLKRLMMTVVLAAGPCALMALYNTGLQANLVMAANGITEIGGWRGALMGYAALGHDPGNILANCFHGGLYYVPIYMVTLFVGMFWEVLFSTIRKHDISEGFLVTSFLFPLILPPDIPLWQVALGISFGVVIGKEVFGGVGMNILNPALTGRAFLFFAYPAEISGNSVWVAVDGVTAATPLATISAAADGVTAATPLTTISDSALSLSITWWDAFLGFIPGSMGETSTLACLLGAGVLIMTGVASARIIISCFAGMAVLALFFNLVGSETNPMFAVSPLWHFVLGGFAFGAIFMATDPVTAAMTDPGKIVFGLMIGALIVIVRVVNPAFPEGDYACYPLL